MIISGKIEKSEDIKIKERRKESIIIVKKEILKEELYIFMTCKYIEKRKEIVEIKCIRYLIINIISRSIFL